MAVNLKASEISRTLQLNGWEPQEALQLAQQIVKASVNDIEASDRLANALVARTGSESFRTIDEFDLLNRLTERAMPDAYQDSAAEQARSEARNTQATQSTFGATDAEQARNKALNQAGTSAEQHVTETFVNTSTSTATVDNHDDAIDEDEEAYIRENYPTFAHWLDHPEVGPVLRQAVAEKWSQEKLAPIIERTDWYQTTSSSEREFDNRYARNPGQLQREIDQQRYMLDSIARTQGIQMGDDELETLATDIIKYGYSEEEILRQLSSRIREQETGPTDGLANIEQALRRMASSYQLTFDDGTLKEYATRIFEGTWSQDAARATFQQQATQFYPHLADQLERGLTVEDYFAPIKARVASILEMNPNDIDMSKGKWASLGQFIDDKGTMRAPTFAEIDQFARNQDEYGYTQQGIASGYEKMNSMLRTLGVMK